jgi:hypothetical protein
VADRRNRVTGLGTRRAAPWTWCEDERLVPVTGAVHGARIRRRIHIPLRFADDYSTIATELAAMLADLTARVIVGCSPRTAP